MSQDPNLFRFFGVSHRYCLHYTGCPDLAYGKIHPWSCRQCEYGRLSEEAASQYIDYQMGANHRPDDPGFDLDLPERILEFTVYPTGDAKEDTHRPINFEVPEEYLEYQVVLGDHR